MRSIRRRSGTGLAELLVTLALAGVVMATAARTLALHLQWQRGRAAAAAADEIVREVHEVLRAEVGRSGGASVLGDTALEVSSLRGFVRACDVSAGRLILPSSPSWWSAPRSGDSVAILDTLARSEWRAMITAVGAQRPSVACPSGGSRLTLASPIPPAVPALALPARVWRVMRYAAYRAGDGSWWLGERSCAPACGLVQPVAGPLLPPAQGGFRLTVVLDGDGQPRAIDLTVRAEVSRRRASLSARLPLRAAP